MFLKLILNKMLKILEILNIFKSQLHFLIIQNVLHFYKKF